MKKSKKYKDGSIEEFEAIKEPKQKADENLELGRSHGIFGKVVLIVILLLLTVFFVRTAIWETNYYNEKEGSPRAIASKVESTVEELDETEVTEEQRAEYTVPAKHPRYLTIEKLGIHNARVLALGLNDLGELDTPNNIFDVGWYEQSGTPGNGGVLVIDGHNGGPNVHGVFKKLDELYNDDIITIERGDGKVFNYRVVENKKVPLSEADEYMRVAFTSPQPGTESITLISCTGEWSDTQQTYLSRQFVRAIIEKD